MSAEAWIALGALIFTVFAATISATGIVLSKIGKDKEELDQELDVIRMSAFEEYKTLRKEIGEISHISRTEFGETVSAIREKTSQIELWFRDRIDDRVRTTDGRIIQIEDRIRKIELFIAKTGFTNGH